jgi:uncharacterized protein (TIRG00374 family)
MIENKNTNHQAKSKRLGGILAISISIGLLFYLMSGLDWSRVAEVLKSTDPYPILLTFIILLIGTLIRAYRWKLLLNSRCKFMDLFDSLNIGNLATMILPLRAGEFIRPYLWARFSGETFGRGFGSVVLERVFDVFGLFVIFLLFVPSTSTIPEYLQLGAKALGAIAGIIGLASIFCLLFPNKARSILNVICNISLLPRAMAEKIRALGEELIVGLTNIGSLYMLMAILVLTIVIWFTYLFGFYLVLYSLDPGQSSLMKAGFICVFIALCVAAPSAPGFLGTYQLGCKLSLVGVFAYTEEFSIGYSLIGHFLQYASIFLLGFLSLLLRGLKFSSLKSASNQSLAQ